MAGHYIAAEVRDEKNRLVSVELVLASDKYLYSFLGGTLREAFPYAPNDLLKHAVIDYGRESGRAGYVLGGGYTKDDGIFRYKKAFDPTGDVPFQRLELIGDRSAYESLIAERLKHERSTDSGARLADGFFPSYRGQVVLDDQKAPH
jgi:lipid II:glycine glycyltransferase (peptidoglycan interpeptide bridge formation enzyme)